MKKLILVIALLLAACGKKDKPTEPINSPDTTTTAPPPPVVLPPPGVETAQTLVAHPDSATLASYMTSVENTYNMYPPEEALKRSEEVSEYTFGHASYDAIVAVDSLASGKLFPTASSSAGALRAPGSVCGSVIYVNGMFTAQDNAYIGAQEVARAVRDAHLPCNFETLLFYNSSALRQISRKTYCLINILCVIGLTYDVGEATLDLLRVLSKLDSKSTPEIKRLAEITQARLALGIPVVAVGQSQGALIVEEAARNLGNTPKCFAAISIAAPADMAGWNVGIGNLDGFVAEGDSVGDVILRLGLNDYPRLKTAATMEADKALAQTRFAPSYTRLTEEYHLHRMLTYTKAPESRARLVEALASYGTALTNLDCLSITPPPPPPPHSPVIPPGMHIYAVSGRPIPFGGPPSDIWIVPPYSNGKDTLVARVVEPGQFEPAVHDIAINSKKEMWGITYYRILRIDKATGKAEEVARMPFGAEGNSMTFDAQDHLYIGSPSGMLYRFTSDFEVDKSGDIGYPISGDITFCANGTLYATVVTDGGEKLARIDTSTFRATIVSSSPIGFKNVWGLYCLGEVLIGLTSAPSDSGQGELIWLSASTGIGSLLRKISFNTFGATPPVP